MESGQTMWLVGAWLSGAKPVAHVEQVTVIDPRGSVIQGPLIEYRHGDRRRLMSVESLADSESEAKLMAARELERLAQPILDVAAALRAEAAVAANERAFV